MGWIGKPIKAFIDKDGHKIIEIAWKSGLAPTVYHRTFVAKYFSDFEKFRQCINLNFYVRVEESVNPWRVYDGTPQYYANDVEPIDQDTLIKRYGKGYLVEGFRCVNTKRNVYRVDF